jgi:hypothetical protein
MIRQRSMAEKDNKIRIIKPNAGFQERFVRSNVDVVFGGGGVGCAKTSAAVLSMAEPTKDSRFRACFTRRNLGDIKTGGGITDDFNFFYGDLVTIKLSDSPRITFPSGAYVECRHIADENPQKLMEQWKGAQFDYIFMDELTSYLEFSTFTTLMTRNRGKASWTGKFRGCTNPKRSHWIRKFIDWYIGADGFLIPERDGVVRYFYINGADVKDVVWGYSKYDVYMKCKGDIDRKLASLGGNVTYDNLIKSFTFYRGRLAENTALLDNNKDYVGSVAAVGGKRSQQLIEGNWNVDEDEEEKIPITSLSASAVFDGDPCINNDMWITCDLATQGKDNTVALVWNGFHIIDILIRKTSTPRENADILKGLGLKHNIGFNHIIYDGINGQYIADYIPEAQAFYSCTKSIGMDRFSVATLKDEAYKRLCYFVNSQSMSFDRNVSLRRYVHQKLKTDVSVQQEFIEECTAVRFKILPNGKWKLWSKEAMNSLLGSERSMDLLDPCAMRMMPILEYEYGKELEMTIAHREVQDTKENMMSSMFYGDGDFKMIRDYEYA